jgi:hypothetical protein
MVAIVRTEWSGTSGGPGLTQLVLQGAGGVMWTPGKEQVAVNAVRSFWVALAPLLPNELTLTVSPVVDAYDTNTGKLIGSYSAPTAPSPVPGTSASNYAAGAGFKVNWNTGAVINGRRVRGSTFIVPAGSNVYDGTGRILAATMTTVNTAASNLLGSLSGNETNLTVWSRPDIKLEETDGVATIVTGGSCSAKTAILRGRRD